MVDGRETAEADRRPVDDDDTFGLGGLNRAEGGGEGIYGAHGWLLVIGERRSHATAPLHRSSGTAVRNGQVGTRISGKEFCGELGASYRPNESRPLFRAFAAG